MSEQEAVVAAAVPVEAQESPVEVRAAKRKNTFFTRHVRSHGFGRPP